MDLLEGTQAQVGMEQYFPLKIITKSFQEDTEKRQITEWSY